jgi:hypothetical protein
VASQSSPTAPPQYAPGSWLALEQNIEAPAPAQFKLDDAVVATFFENDVPRAAGGFTYAYGGKTRNKVLPSSTPGNGAVFAAYFDDDYSGVNI